MKSVISKLAIEGGTPVRCDPLPSRYAIGPMEREMIDKVLDYYQDKGADFGYQGHFEELYCEAFVEMMGGGYADSVATGTAAVFIAVASCNLPKGSEVIVSPITDPGTYSAITMNGLIPKLCDSAPGSYNMGVEEFESRISPNTSAVVVVHAAGQSAPIQEIVDIANRHGLKVIEDCSQSHGAISHDGQTVGTVGDIAAFSTMFKKAHVTGASGGMVYSKNLELYHMALAHADRGKPRWQQDYDDRNPSNYLFPALNLHTDEISCAIGLASLSRLSDTRKKRLQFIDAIADGLQINSRTCEGYSRSHNDSPFFYPVIVDCSQISCSKQAFAEAVLAEGISLSTHYNYIGADWPWLKAYLADDFDCPNARAIRDNSFNLYLNENCGGREVEDTLTAILKVEHHFSISV